MPKLIHDKLVREALDKGLKGKRKNAYVYGTLSKIEEAIRRKRKKSQ